MRVTLRTIEYGGRSARRFGVSCFSLTAFATCMFTGGGAHAQETLTIGARAPAVEINENAVYYGAPIQLGSETELPLFDPVEDNLESRLMDLRALNRTRALSAPTNKSSTFEQKKTPASHVVELPSIQRTPVEVTSKVVNTSSLETQTPRATSSTEEFLTSETNTAAVAPKYNEVQPSTAKDSQGTSSPASANMRDREPPIPSPPTELKPISDEERTRLQLKAYASAQDSSASAARRLSLSRALAVRSFLIESGVSSTRIDVRALGAKSEAGPPDRVDLVVVH